MAERCMDVGRPGGYYLSMYTQPVYNITLYHKESVRSLVVYLEHGVRKKWKKNYYLSTHCKRICLHSSETKGRYVCRLKWLISINLGTVG